MDSSQLDSFSVYVGIDWATTKHDVCIHIPGKQARQFETIPHQVEDIDLWVRSLKRQHGGPIAVAIELSKGPIVSILDKYDFIVLFPINPLTLAKYRTAFQAKPCQGRSYGCRIGDRPAPASSRSICATAATEYGNAHAGHPG